VSHRAGLLQQAIKSLGVERLVLSIHDVSFPSRPEEDIGWGSPYSEGGRELLRFVQELGFTGVQLGPQGELSDGNPSPYDASMFSRSPLSIALTPLTTDEWGELLTQQEVDEIVRQAPTPEGRAHYRYAEQAMSRALQTAFERFSKGSPRAEELARFCSENHEWLLRGALYSLLCKRNAGRAPWDWEDAKDRRLFAPALGEEVASEERKQLLLREHHTQIEAYKFSQFVIHQQHQKLRGYARSLGLSLYGDLQIGMSLSDTWGLQELLLRGYLLGAPPSRTNPEGQPWGYPLLAPERYMHGGLAMVQARLRKLFAEFDGVRIDHPHGLIDPWVYRADHATPLLAVQSGARLFSSPGLSDHPALDEYAIAAREQLNESVARYADDWVSDLNTEQTARYATIFEVIMRCAREAGASTQAIICEVLSTMPYPVRVVMERFGLGRFRVTQKANTQNPRDVYRTENASPQDWVMVGTHDTAPIWLLLERWQRDGSIKEQAAYLAWRLSPTSQEPLAQALAQDPYLLAQAKFADLFLGPAQNVSIFFSDLFGQREVYNTPGTISEQNWTLRLPHDYQQRYEEQRRERRALDLPLALSLALRSRGTEEHKNLADKLSAER
jgi:4-alpha-glucanotransferase